MKELMIGINGNPQDSERLAIDLGLRIRTKCIVHDKKVQILRMGLRDSIKNILIRIFRIWDYNYNVLNVYNNEYRDFSQKTLDQVYYGDTVQSWIQTIENAVLDRNNDALMDMLLNEIMYEKIHIETDDDTDMVVMIPDVKRKKEAQKIKEQGGLVFSINKYGNQTSIQEVDYNPIYTDASQISIIADDIFEAYVKESLF